VRKSNTKAAFGLGRCFISRRGFSRLNFELYKLKANVFLRQALTLFLIKGRTADGKTGRERHRKIFFTQFCRAKLQRTGGGKNGFYGLLLSFRRLKFPLRKTCIAIFSLIPFTRPPLIGRNNSYRCAAEIWLRRE